MTRPPCFNCQAPSCHDHHVVPRSLGGVSTVPLCAPCHGLAHGHRGYRNTPELTKRALAKKKARGECVGTVPYGFRREGDVLVEDEAEQAVLACVRGFAAAGLSQRAIVAELVASGHLSRSGKPFAKTQVHRMVSEAAR